MFPEVIDKQGGLLDQLSTFLGINRDLFDSEVVKVRTNYNDGHMTSRGMDKNAISTVRKVNRMHRPYHTLFLVIVRFFLKQENSSIR